MHMVKPSFFQEEMNKMRIDVTHCYTAQEIRSYAFEMEFDQSERVREVQVWSIGEYFYAEITTGQIPGYLSNTNALLNTNYTMTYMTGELEDVTDEYTEEFDTGYIKSFTCMIHTKKELVTNEANTG